jgi:hypothetical protein
LKDFKDNTDIKDVIILIAMPLVDVYGKKTTEVELNITFSDETRKMINWSNFIFKNIPNIADVYIEHPVMQ